jgi:hypothetical protein
MKPRSKTARILSVAALAGAASSPFEAPPALAQAPEPTGTASSSAAASAPAAEAPKGIAVSAYSWPNSPSPVPSDAEWAQATALAAMTLKLAPSWWDKDVDVTCAPIAVREWVRLTCTPRHGDKPSKDILFGVVWGVAGDLSSVKGQFQPASELPLYQKMAPGLHGDLFRKMGASATVTFQVRPESAFVLSIGRIGWDFGYDGSWVFSRSGVLVDVSWAAGEKAPVIACVAH